MGGTSIINWRAAAIIISKALSPGDVANYEISYKIFSMVQLLPIVVATTFFPILINLFKDDKIKELSAF
jgi:O-antigen/teichoic acid export membrane protein